MEKIFPEGFIFQHDGSPIHTAEITTKYINKKIPQLLVPPEWPPYSPDLNPIENIWAWLKDRVNRDMPKTIISLKKCTKKHWKVINEFFEFLL